MGVSPVKAEDAGVHDDDTIVVVVVVVGRVATVAMTTEEMD